MSAIAIYRSTIGKKAIMATTGVILFGFVAGHILGNLQVFLGPQKINDYSAFLKHTPSLLWGTRVVLLIAVVLHIVSAIQLSRMQRSARPVGYARRRSLESTFASRTMLVSGVLLFLFIVFHLLHLTTGTLHPSFSEDDVYSNMVNGFRVIPVAVFYVVAMTGLFLHLRHGVWSLFQSLGVNTVRTDGMFRSTATVFSALIYVGFISIPIAVVAGVLQ